MIDFSAITRQSTLGRLLRKPLQWLPPSTVVRVLQGQLRGAKWVVGSGVHGCWLGSYERDKQNLLARRLRPGQVFYDVGANVGFYSLLAARLVGASGKVHAFEPLPENLEYLRRHVALNRADRVKVHPLALSDSDGTARFGEDENRSQGRLSDAGGLEVRTARIDTLVAEGLDPPDIVKMDIEGAEVSALRGARNTLEHHHPLLFVATHGPEPHRGTLELLGDLGYHFTAIGAGDIETTDELEARFDARRGHD